MVQRYNDKNSLTATVTLAMLKINRPTYFRLQTWMMADIVQLATQDFCKRFLMFTPCQNVAVNQTVLHNTGRSGHPSIGR